MGVVVVGWGRGCSILLMPSWRFSGVQEVQVEVLGKVQVGLWIEVREGGSRRDLRMT